MIPALALRNALRNRRRSVLTAAMVLFGAAFLTVAMCWVEGIFSTNLENAANIAGHVRLVTEEYARREQVNPLAENIADTKAMEEALRAVPGVTGVYPRISMGVTATVRGDLGDEFGMVQGAPLSFYEGPFRLPKYLMSGRMLAADDEVILGKSLAEKLGANLDDEVILLGQTQDGSLSPAKVKLVGIVDLGNAMQNKQIFLTLEKVRYMADIPDGAVFVSVYGNTRDDGQPLAAAISALPVATGMDVKSWDQRPPFDQMLGLVGTVQGVIATVMVFITGLGVLNTMLMSVLERTREIGVLRAMGLKRYQVMQLFVLEAVGIAALGGLLGAVAGGLGGYYLQIHGVDLGAAVDKLPATIPFNSTVHAKVTVGILGRSVLLGLAMALVGGAVPAWRAAKIQPIEAMRHHR